MEAFSPLVPNRASVFSSFTLSTRNRKNLHKFHLPISKFRRSRFSPCYLPLSGIKKIQVYAHFGQKSKRRNSLREKLVDDQKVLGNSISFDPGTYSRNLSPNFDDLADLSDVKESEPKTLSESNLLNELESWITRYKKEAGYWGIGSNPIFTVFEDSGGNVEKVRVDENEIIRRSRESEDLAGVDAKILYAKELAQEMEGGKNVILRNSSVAKFVDPREESSLIDTIRAVDLQPYVVPKLKVIGKAMFCTFVVFAVVRMVCRLRTKEVKLTEYEKQMMRRKVKARKSREVLETGSVEVVASDTPLVSFERPKLDEQELKRSISNAKASKAGLELLDSSTANTSSSVDFNNKIQEIKDMAKRAREIEAAGQSDSVHGEEESQVVGDEPDEQDVEESTSFLISVPDGDSDEVEHDDEADVLKILDEPSTETIELNGSYSSNFEIKSTNNMMQDAKEIEDMSHPAVNGLTVKPSGVTNGGFGVNTNGSVQRRPRIIRSVKEARDFLSKKHGEKKIIPADTAKTSQESENAAKLQKDGQLDGNVSPVVKATTNGGSKSMLDPISNQENSLNGHAPPDNKNDSQDSKSIHAADASEKYSVEDIEPLPIKEDNALDFDDEANIDKKPLSSLDNAYKEDSTVPDRLVSAKNWVEKNFHEFEPIVKKIRAGFNDNYMVAREKASAGATTSSDISQLRAHEDDSELDWMRNDKLRDIVFQVRDNELAGRHPFHLMDHEDKEAFFRGLEKKVEKENQKLSHLHQWLHSNIENLDYGADGISIYDPPEKIIPRWKGPPLEKNPEFLNNYFEQRKALYSEKASPSSPVKKDKKSSAQRSAELPADGKVAPSSTNDNERKDLNISRTVVESSDGTAKPGKKSGKEFWQHTKKWSEGFLQSYNEEKDLEVKAAMKDIGKDLDRWITEKEIQEAADLMTKLPQRNKKFMEKKLNKLRREMELFGPRAVVSKYSEYADDKEEDCLWWLDLPHVLCIELYTIDDKEQRVGFYALEMASDLELEPKPHHVIAFEDAADCKNLCYIVQAHLEMLGKGNAFIVPRPPKEAFREAKINGFGVTVIRKGELQLNIDQTLEEVEEQICEIGSKMYHDMIMRDRSVDISSLMKGVFGLKSKNPRSKVPKKMLRRLKKK